LTSTGEDDAPLILKKCIENSAAASVGSAIKCRAIATKESSPINAFPHENPAIN
jgi:hypothetical protein